MNAEQNELITRIGPGTPCGALLRSYWQPAALVDEFDPRSIRAWRSGRSRRCACSGRTWCCSGRRRAAGACSTATARIAAPTCRSAATRATACAAPSTAGSSTSTARCLETPAEPAGSKLCERVRQRSYPVLEKSGVLFAWLGRGRLDAAAFPDFDCFVAPSTHSFAFKGLWHANWLQAFEVGIDPAHPSFLHRYLQDEPLEASARTPRASSSAAPAPATSAASAGR